MRVLTPEIEAEIHRLYVPYVRGAKTVARIVGVSEGTVWRVLSAERRERDRVLSWEAKQRRRGTCERCGGVTRYNGHSVNGPSRICTSCNARAAAEREKLRRGTGPLEQRILGLLASGPRRFSEITTELGLYHGLTGSTLHRLLRYGLIYRPSRGVYAIVEEVSGDAP
jgi:hypothetical protein